ncbi:MAG: Sodium/glucose cotransporter [Calditrichaeota bacterium]|nr:Sodium/glucose cotransporter [Calditrichota bacterium]
MSDFTLHPIDIGVLSLYAVFVVTLGIWLARRHGNAEDYFLAGRGMTWPLIGASLYASNMSSTSLVGLAGSGYGTGISVFNYEWMAAVILIIFAFFFLPFYLRSRVYTMPEFLARRYDGRSRTYFSLITLLGNIIIDTAGSLYAGALVMQMIFPEVPIWQTIVVMAVLAGAYTIAGGLSAVMITDAVQAALLQIGAIVVAFIAFVKIGGDWTRVTDVTDREMLSLVMPLSDDFLPWLGLITGVPLLGFYFWCTNQFMVQRVLSAKDVHHGRLGAIFAGFLKVPVIFIMVLPGTMARVFYPNLENPDMVYPMLMFDMLPIGLLGLVLAGFVAALMSQIDSTLNSASTLVTMDFVRRAKPDWDNRKLMIVGRWVTFIFMVLAALWAPQIQRFGSLFHYLQNVLAYITPPVVAVFIWGLFWNRANASGAIAALLSGFVVSIFLLLGTIFAWIPEIHFLYVAGILFVFSTVVLFAVSLVTAPPSEQVVREYTWSKRIFRQETRELRGLPWYANYRVLSVILLACTAVVVGMFW